MLKKRLEGLDIFRGLAIFFMVIYHFSYDLNYFHFISVDMNHTHGFLIARYTIMSMFLLSVGISLALTHRDSIQWQSVRKRTIHLTLASLLVTIATYIIFPNSWVYFGILHFILVASLLLLPLIHLPKVSLILALFILLGSATNTLNMHQLFTLVQSPLMLPTYSEDLVPLFPWFAVVLLGAVSVHYNLHTKLFKQKIFSYNTPLHKLLKKMGQHSLLIYLLHQPILFGAFELYFTLFSK